MTKRLRVTCWRSTPNSSSRQRERRSERKQDVAEADASFLARKPRPAIIINMNQKTMVAERSRDPKISAPISSAPRDLSDPVPMLFVYRGTITGAVGVDACSNWTPFGRRLFEVRSSNDHSCWGRAITLMRLRYCATPMCTSCADNFDAIKSILLLPARMWRFRRTEWTKMLSEGWDNWIFTKGQKQKALLEITNKIDGSLKSTKLCPQRGNYFLVNWLHETFIYYIWHMKVSSILWFTKKYFKRRFIINNNNNDISSCLYCDLRISDACTVSNYQKFTTNYLPT